MLKATEFIISRRHPDYYAIVHEPKAEGEQAKALVKHWVEAACELAKRLDPAVKTSATALNSERGIAYIELIHSRGKEAWIEELWLTTQWDRRTPDPADMFPGFNDPCRAWWDARFLRVMAYYAQRNDLLGIEPWFTTYFVLYPGYDDLWEFEDGRCRRPTTWRTSGRPSLKGGGP